MISDTGMTVKQLEYSNCLLVEYIKRRVLEHNKNFVAIITGGTGSGKSYGAVRIGESVDPNFTIKNVAFTPKEFMRIINSKNLKRGSCIILDEGQISMNRRDWFSISNKLLNLVFSTFRNMNLVVIFTTPNFDYIDSQMMKLFTMHFQTNHILKDEKKVLMKTYFLKYDSINKRMYHQFPTWTVGQMTKRSESIKISMPSFDLVRAYEDKKKTFNKKLNKDIEETIYLTEAGEAIKLSQKHRKIIEMKTKENHQEPTIAEQLAEVD